MNKYYISIFAILLPVFIHAQQFDRSIVWGGIQADNAAHIEIDDAGDIICSGTFTGNAHFPIGTINGEGFQDIFVTKSSSDGSPIWEISIGGPNTDQVLAMNLDSDGNIWLAGRFQGNIDLNPGPGLTVINASPSGNIDGFLAKYSGIDGSLIESYNISAGGILDIRSIQTNDQGDVFIAGQFVQTVDFDLGPGQYELSSTLNSADGFIAKYNSEMELQWVNQVGSFTPAIDYFSDLKLSPDGSLYVTGLIGGNADIDPGNGIVMVNAAIDAVLIRYSQFDGSLSWGFNLGGNSIEIGVSLLISEDLDVIMTGTFNSSSMDVDPGAGSFIISKLGSDASPFITRYSSEGELVSAVVLEATANSTASINKLIPGFGNTIIALGNFNGSIDIDLKTDSEELLVSENGSTDGFVAQYESNWELDKLIHIGGEGNEIINDGVLSGIYLSVACQFDDFCKPNANDTTTIALKSSGFDASILVWNMLPTVLSVEQQSKSNDFVIFPNPANNYFSVKTDKPNLEIRIWDVEGRLILHSKAKSNINISHLDSGVYLIEEISTKGPSAYKRFIKQ